MRINFVLATLCLLLNNAPTSAQAPTLQVFPYNFGELQLLDLSVEGPPASDFTIYYTLDPFGGEVYPLMSGLLDAYGGWGTVIELPSSFELPSLVMAAVVTGPGSAPALTGLVSGAIDLCGFPCLVGCPVAMKLQFYYEEKTNTSRFAATVCTTHEVRLEKVLPGGARVLVRRSAADPGPAGVKGLQWTTQVPLQPGEGLQIVVKDGNGGAVVKTLTPIIM